MSRWENGETTPNTETLKRLSNLFNVSINALHIENMPQVAHLNALVGQYVNLEYPLPGGQRVQFLNDQTTYLGTQLEPVFGGDRRFGVVASMDFILIAAYEAEGAYPELLLFKKR